MELAWMTEATWTGLAADSVSGDKVLDGASRTSITKDTHGARFTPKVSSLPVTNGIIPDSVLTASWYQPEEVADGDAYEGVPRLAAGEKYQAWAVTPGTPALKSCGGDVELTTASALLAATSTLLTLAGLTG